jgi:hypothetical protein
MECDGEYCRLYDMQFAQVDNNSTVKTVTNVGGQVNK